MGSRMAMPAGFSRLAARQSELGGPSAGAEGPQPVRRPRAGVAGVQAHPRSGTGKTPSGRGTGALRHGGGGAGGREAKACQPPTCGPSELAPRLRRRRRCASTTQIAPLYPRNCV